MNHRETLDAASRARETSYVSSHWKTCGVSLKGMGLLAGISLSDGDQCATCLPNGELLAACWYALGVLESMPEQMREELADILDEDVDFEMLEAAVSNANAARKVL